MSQDHAVLIGLTGGIASGKSTVSAHMTELGARVIDADQIAREVVAPGQPALDEIRAQFGPDVFQDDGALDRAALGQLVFSSKTERAKLGAITHPRIGALMYQRAQEALADGHAWVLYDAALLVENGIHHALDALIVVACDPETQRARILTRDGLTPAEADQRIASQLPLADKVAVADHVIDNNGSLEATLEQTRALHARIDAAIRAHGTAKPGASS